MILQPRRLATRLLAARVASERNGRLGDEVGYQIRFENITSNRTRIRFVTEGILLRQLIQDPQLRGVSAILFDEFHERHLYGDITLARALQLQATSRPDLKLAVMSATLDAGLLAKISGTLRRPELRAAAPFRSTIEYLPKPVGGDGYPIWDLAADELERVAPRTEGDVLIFMPGKYEINRTISAIRASRVSDRFVVLPLHGELPPAEQDAALAHYEKRRAIVATNVAETSLTIDGVRVVIDSGLARIARFDSAPRHQHPAHRKNQPRFRRATRRTRRPDRPGPLPAALDGARASRSRAAGIARGESGSIWPRSFSP